ncbi:hypothetical protein D9756_007881 [Leucocoprinus leucothites]|uniref:21S rRNA pseudouridine(2819) synthase n=1 Tax=Leucocoprinus leucothites TaxID=201217 RepID=A0A8H5FXL6_9AGAR|nr:hypothetical protein D9756_007881 [Leucoagaricus leucothites]
MRILPNKTVSIKQAAKMVEDCLLYYDRGIFLANKPSKMVCQMSYSTSAQYENFNILCKGIQRKLNMLRPPNSVHRLDKDTTGALLLARSPMWASRLQDQFNDGSIRKTYLALVHGGSEKFRETSGVIETGMSEVDGRVRLDPLGKVTRTEWEVLGSSPKVPLTLMRLKLLTGHKHQLRVHLAKCLNAPVIGDPLYAKDVPPEEIKITRQIAASRKNMFLHASEISFYRWTKERPIKRFELSFRVPVPTKFDVVCRDSKIPVDRQLLLRQGRMFVNGQPWTEASYVYRESEKCWVSPELIPQEPTQVSQTDSENAVPARFKPYSQPHTEDKSNEL